MLLSPRLICEVMKIVSIGMMTSALAYIYKRLEKKNVWVGLASCNYRILLRCPAIKSTSQNSYPLNAQITIMLKSHGAKKIDISIDYYLM